MDAFPSFGCLIQNSPARRAYYKSRDSLFPPTSNLVTRGEIHRAKCPGRVYTGRGSKAEEGVRWKRE